MAGIKNKDGSINWSKVKVNPVINTVWGETVKLNPCKNSVDEIKAFIDSQYDEAIKNIKAFIDSHQYDEAIKNMVYNRRELFYNRRELSEYSKYVGRASLCEDLLDFIDRIIEL